jgi:hypothetical protein
VSLCMYISHEYSMTDWRSFLMMFARLASKDQKWLWSRLICPGCIQLCVYVVVGGYVGSCAGQSRLQLSSCR